MGRSPGHDRAGYTRIRPLSRLRAPKQSYVHLAYSDTDDGLIINGLPFYFGLFLALAFPEERRQRAVLLPLGKTG